jgi:hypothetical protein
MNRDLDAEIVKTIFNWRYITVSSDANGDNKCRILYPPDREPDQDFYNTLPRVGTLHEGWNAPTYSRDFKLAFNLGKYVGLPMMLCDIPENPEELAKQCLTWWKYKNQIS